MTIYRYGNSFSDRPGGTGNAELATAIKQITVGKRRRVSGRLLDPPAQPEAIPAERKTVPRIVGAENARALGGGGLVDPIMIQPYTDGEVYQDFSSERLLVREYAAITTTIDDGGEGVSNTWVEPDPNA